jgi:hypothetical protein
MSKLVQMESVDSKLAKQQVAFGRGYSNFLYPPKKPVISLFGLSKLSTILPMMRTAEHRLELLRDIAARHSLNNGHTLFAISPQGSVDHRLSNTQLLFVMFFH